MAVDSIQSSSIPGTGYQAILSLRRGRGKESLSKVVDFQSGMAALVGNRLILLGL